VYQQPADFVAEAFTNPPARKALWINDSIKAAARQRLGRDIHKLRIRYWREGNRSAWILDEIGKDLPITTGVVIDSGRIERVSVLIFRESRGWEVRYPFFTEQFDAAELTAGGELDRRIDNISGATMSVNALKRQASLALFLSEYLDADAG
jgi:hypothetical protein